MNLAFTEKEGDSKIFQDLHLVLTNVRENIYYITECFFYLT